MRWGSFGFCCAVKLSSRQRARRWPGEESLFACIVSQSKQLSTDQRPSCNLFQYSIRRGIRSHQRPWRNQKCLLDRVLSGHHRMRHAICEHHPRRKRRKRNLRFCPAPLKRRIFLQIIVKPQHKHVIRRSTRRRDSQFRAQILHGSGQKRIVFRDLL